MLYTRAPTVDAAYVPELTAAAEKLGLKWSDLIQTDNTCGPAPPLAVTRPRDLDDVADDVRALEREAESDVEVLEATLEKDLVSFSRGFTLLKGSERKVEAAASAFVSKEQKALRDEVRSRRKCKACAYAAEPCADAMHAAQIERAEAALDELERAAGQADARGPLQALLRLLGLAKS